jgi:acetate kinase
MKCLIANIGVTSFKYRLLEMPEEAVLARGHMERIGQPDGVYANYPAAIRKCIAEIAGEGKALKNLSEIEAVGFKVVHAGPLNESQIIDDQFLAAMEEFTFLAPAHNPPYIAAIQDFRKELPGVPLVAVIETSPYRFMNEAATTYAAPYEWREKYGICRYGFHGASHRAANEHTSKLMGRNNLRHISCQLGGSASLAAFRDGVAVDVSMGASPQSGLPQSNRVGDIDAFAVLHMMRKLNVGPDEMARILGSQSGLAGISGTSGDMRDLDQAAAAGEKRSRLALDVFVRATRHYLGAFLLELGGVDVVTFSGGIGENSAETRAGVLKGLTAFGIELDASKNRSTKGLGAISTEDSAVKIFIVPANEEIIVARETVKVVAESIAAAEAKAALYQGTTLVVP